MASRIWASTCAGEHLVVVDAAVAVDKDLQHHGIVDDRRCRRRAGTRSRAARRAGDFERHVASFYRLRRGEGADEHGGRSDEEDSAGEAGGGAEQERLESVLPADVEAAQPLAGGIAALLRDGDAEAEREIGGDLCGPEVREPGPGSSSRRQTHGRSRRISRGAS